MIGRVFRLVRTPITLLVLLGVLCWGAYWGWNNIIAPVPAAPPVPCVNQTVAKGKLLSSQVTVSIFNGGTKRGLAGDVGRLMRERDFKVERTTDTTEKIQKTVIVGAGVKNPEVLLVKAFFKGAEVRADKRADHTVDILVGNKYGGFNKKASTSYAVKTDKVCLPPSVATPAGS